MEHDIPEAPVIFMKPPTALLQKKDFYIPSFTNNLHYECELVYRICKNGKSISETFAPKYYDAVTVGIDFTARDIQADCKKKGLPWEISKAFDNSAVVGNWVETGNLSDASSTRFSMKKNGQTVQSANAGEMLFNIHYLIQYISKYFTLQQGDIIFTGTPQGVGNVQIGDKLEGFLMGDKKYEIDIK